jgi:hypothetical protein
MKKKNGKKKNTLKKGVNPPTSGWRCTHPREPTTGKTKVTSGHVTSGQKAPLGRILRNFRCAYEEHISGHGLLRSRDFRLLHYIAPLQMWLELSLYTTRVQKGPVSYIKKPKLLDVLSIK